MKKSISLLVMVCLLMMTVFLTGCGEPEVGETPEPEKDIVEEIVKKNPVYKLRLSRILYRGLNVDAANKETFEIEQGSEKTVHINETIKGTGLVSYTIEGDVTLTVEEDVGYIDVICTKYSLNGSETNGRGVTSELTATGTDSSSGQLMGLDSKEYGIEFSGDAEGDRHMGHAVFEVVEVKR